MKKLFRIKYKPRNGRYHPEAEFSPVNQSIDNAISLLERIAAILEEPDHGNENISYGLDYDERTEVFIASFVHYGNLDLYTSHNRAEAVGMLVTGVTGWCTSEEGKRLLSERPGKWYAPSSVREKDDSHIQLWNIRMGKAGRSRVVFPKDSDQRVVC